MFLCWDLLATNEFRMFTCVSFLILIVARCFQWEIFWFICPTRGKEVVLWQLQRHVKGEVQKHVGCLLWRRKTYLDVTWNVVQMNLHVSCKEEAWSIKMPFIENRFRLKSGVWLTFVGPLKGKRIWQGIYLSLPAVHCLHESIWSDQFVFRFDPIITCPLLEIHRSRFSDLA